MKFSHLPDFLEKLRQLRIYKNFKTVKFINILTRIFYFL